jgi:HemY protein
VAHEAAQLASAQWALDDRDASKALALLDAMPAGVARRTQALRLRLQAQRLDNQPLAALQTARLLAKHQAFAPHVVQGLMRSLTAAAMNDARDSDQARAAWSTFNAQEKRDPIIAAQATRVFVKHGQSHFARTLIEPLWGSLEAMPADERAALAQALTTTWDRVDAPGAHERAALAGGGDASADTRAPVGVGAVEALDARSDWDTADSTTWLARLETTTRQLGQDAAIALAAGTLYAQRRLWGKARPALEQAAHSSSLAAPWRQRAWRRLAELARAQNDEARAQRCDQQAAALGAAEAS